MGWEDKERLWVGMSPWAAGSTKMTYHTAGKSSEEYP